MSIISHQYHAKYVYDQSLQFVLMILQKKTHFVAKPNDQIQEIALVVYDPIVMFIFELVKRQIELQEIHTKVTQ